MTVNSLRLVIECGAYVSVPVADESTSSVEDESATETDNAHSPHTEPQHEIEEEFERHKDEDEDEAWESDNSSSGSSSGESWSSAGGSTVEGGSPASGSGSSTSPRRKRKKTKSPEELLGFYANQESIPCELMVSFLRELLLAVAEASHSTGSAGGAEGEEGTTAAAEKGDTSPTLPTSSLIKTRIHRIEQAASGRSMVVDLTVVVDQPEETAAVVDGSQAESPPGVVGADYWVEHCRKLIEGALLSTQGKYESLRAKAFHCEASWDSNIHYTLRGQLRVAGPSPFPLRGSEEGEGEEEHCGGKVRVDGCSYHPSATTAKTTMNVKSTGISSATTAFEESTGSALQLGGNISLSHSDTQHTALAVVLVTDTSSATSGEDSSTCRSCTATASPAKRVEEVKELVEQLAVEEGGYVVAVEGGGGEPQPHHGSCCCLALTIAFRGIGPNPLEGGGSYRTVSQCALRFAHRLQEAVHSTISDVGQRTATATGMCGGDESAGGSSTGSGPLLRVDVALTAGTLPARTLTLTSNEDSRRSKTIVVTGGQTFLLARQLLEEHIARERNRDDSVPVVSGPIHEVVVTVFADDGVGWLLHHQVAGSQTIHWHTNHKDSGTLTTTATAPRQDRPSPSPHRGAKKETVLSLGAAVGTVLPSWYVVLNWGNDTATAGYHPPPRPTTTTSAAGEGEGEKKKSVRLQDALGLPIQLLGPRIGELYSARRLFSFVCTAAHGQPTLPTHRAAGTGGGATEATGHGWMGFLPLLSSIERFLCPVLQKPQRQPQPQLEEGAGPSSSVHFSSETPLVSVLLLRGYMKSGKTLLLTRFSRRLGLFPVLLIDLKNGRGFTAHHHHQQQTTHGGRSNFSSTSLVDAVLALIALQLVQLAECRGRQVQYQLVGLRTAEEGDDKRQKLVAVLTDICCIFLAAPKPAAPSGSGSDSEQPATTSTAGIGSRLFLLLDNAPADHTGLFLEELSTVLQSISRAVQVKNGGVTIPFVVIATTNIVHCAGFAASSSISSGRIKSTGGADNQHGGEEAADVITVADIPLCCTQKDSEDFVSDLVGLSRLTSAAGGKGWPPILLSTMTTASSGGSTPAASTPNTSLAPTVGVSPPERRAAPPEPEDGEDEFESLAPYSPVTRGPTSFGRRGSVPQFPTFPPPSSSAPEEEGKSEGLFPPTVVTSADSAKQEPVNENLIGGTPSTSAGTPAPPPPPATAASTTPPCVTGLARVFMLASQHSAFVLRELLLEMKSDTLDRLALLPTDYHRVCFASNAADYMLSTLRDHLATLLKVLTPTEYHVLLACCLYAHWQDISGGVLPSGSASDDGQGCRAASPVEVSSYASYSIDREALQSLSLAVADFLGIEECDEKETDGKGPAGTCTLIQRVIRHSPVLSSILIWQPFGPASPPSPPPAPSPAQEEDEDQVYYEQQCEQSLLLLAPFVRPLTVLAMSHRLNLRRYIGAIVDHSSVVQELLRLQPEADLWCALALNRMPLEPHTLSLLTGAAMTEGQLGLSVEELHFLRLKMFQVLASWGVRPSSLGLDQQQQHHHHHRHGHERSVLHMPEWSAIVLQQPMKLYMNPALFEALSAACSASAGQHTTSTGTVTTTLAAPPKSPLSESWTSPYRTHTDGLIGWRSNTEDAEGFSTETGGKPKQPAGRGIRSPFGHPKQTGGGANTAPADNLQLPEVGSIDSFVAYDKTFLVPSCRAHRKTRKVAIMVSTEVGIPDIDTALSRLHKALGHASRVHSSLDATRKAVQLAAASASTHVHPNPNLTDSTCSLHSTSGGGQSPVMSGAIEPCQFPVASPAPPQPHQTPPEGGETPQQLVHAVQYVKGCWSVLKGILLALMKANLECSCDPRYQAELGSVEKAVLGWIDQLTAAGKTGRGGGEGTATPSTQHVDPNADGALTTTTSTTVDDTATLTLNDVREKISGLMTSTLQIASEVFVRPLKPDQVLSSSGGAFDGANQRIEALKAHHNVLKGILVELLQAITAASTAEMATQNSGSLSLGSPASGTGSGTGSPTAPLTPTESSSGSLQAAHSPTGSEAGRKSVSTPTASLMAAGVDGSGEGQQRRSFASFTPPPPPPLSAGAEDPHTKSSSGNKAPPPDKTRDLHSITLSCVHRALYYCFVQFGFEESLMAASRYPSERRGAHIAAHRVILSSLARLECELNRTISTDRSWATAPLRAGAGAGGSTAGSPALTSPTALGGGGGTAAMASASIEELLRVLLHTIRLHIAWADEDLAQHLEERWGDVGYLCGNLFSACTSTRAVAQPREKGTATSTGSRTTIGCMDEYCRLDLPRVEKKATEAPKTAPSFAPLKTSGKGWRPRPRPKT